MTVPPHVEMTHLEALEAESIHIIREVAADGHSADPQVGAGARVALHEHAHRPTALRRRQPPRCRAGASLEAEAGHAGATAHVPLGRDHAALGRVDGRTHVLGLRRPRAAGGGPAW